MSLRRKLGLLSLVLLVLPWAAWRFIGTTESLLRSGEEQALLATAGTLARSLETLGALPATRDGPGLYVWPADRPVSVDGYADEWRDWPDPRPLPRLAGIAAAPARARLAIAADRGGLYLLVTVDDSERVYRPSPSAPASAGDHLRLQVARGGHSRELVVSTLAPGSVRARPATDAGPRRRIAGQWQETADGYSVELRIPDPATVTGLGVAVADRGDRGITWYGTGNARSPVAPRQLVRPDADLGARIAALLPRGTRGWLVDGEGWILARAGALDLTGAGRPWLRNLIYRHLLASPLAPPAAREAPHARLQGDEVAAALAGSPASQWRAVGGAGGVVVSAAQPLPGGGALVVEQASDGVLLLTDRAMVEMLGTVLLSVAVALAVLLAFAGRLSRRIRGLRDAAAGALGERGEVHSTLPEQRAGDELGDLSRSLSQTLEALRRYTGYLRSLTGRLAHELRTPLAIVTSSLDNLDPATLPAAGQRYAERARTGAGRLGTLLRAMSEATRIEQSLAETPGETVALDRLLRDYAEAYQSLHPDRDIALRIGAGPHTLHGAPELIGQLLDKLVDNAADFTPPGGWIRLGLERAGQCLRLTVANQGPPLPAALQSRAFDALVSGRESAGDDDRAHLGLGLTIVRLVAERHGGSVTAANLADGAGVVFTVELRDLPGD